MIVNNEIFPEKLFQYQIDHLYIIRLHSHISGHLYHPICIAENITIQKCHDVLGTNR